MHIAWTRYLLDNKEFIVGGGTQPNTEPSRGEGLDGSAAVEERISLHDMRRHGGQLRSPRDMRGTTACPARANPKPDPLT